MRIQDVNARKIEACFSFEYRGFTVSVSSVFHPGYCVIAIYLENRFLTEECTSVPDAIAYIDNLTQGPSRVMREALGECLTLEGARCMKAPSLSGFLRRLQAVNTSALKALKRDGESAYATIARVKS